MSVSSAHREKKLLRCKWHLCLCSFITFIKAFHVSKKQLKFSEPFFDVLPLLHNWIGCAVRSMSCKSASFSFWFYFGDGQLAAGRSLNSASFWGRWGERTCPRCVAAIHSVALGRTPNLSNERRLWTIAELFCSCLRHVLPYCYTWRHT